MLSKKPWQVEYVLMFCGALFMGLCLTSIVAEVLHKAKVNGFVSENDFGFLFCATMGIQGIAWILIPIFLRLHHTSLRVAFGFDRPGLVKALLLAGGVLLLALPVVLGLQSLSINVLERLGLPESNEKAVEMFLGINTAWGRAYFVFFAIVLAPVAEEFIFRGMLYPFIKQQGWPKCAFIGVSALFALIHWDAAAFISLFVLAGVLTWLYEKTDRLLASIAAHSLFNTINMVLLLFEPQISAWMNKTGHGPLSP
jgi:uncharacterized protein